MAPENTAAQLFDAIQKRDVDGARKLIASEPALARARNAQGVSSLMLARYYNLPPVVEALLSTRPELDIFEASALGDSSRLCMLLDADGSQVNARSPDGGTALHFACFFVQPECAKELVKRGADVNALAVNFGNVRPLHSAAAGHDTEIVRLLLEAGADANQKQNEGWTALHSAAQHGDTEMVRLLLSHGADPNATADNGQTASDLARATGHNELATLLASA